MPTYSSTLRSTWKKLLNVLSSQSMADKQSSSRLRNNGVKLNSPTSDRRKREVKQEVKAKERKFKEDSKLATNKDFKKMLGF